MMRAVESFGKSKKLLLFKVKIRNTPCSYLRFRGPLEGGYDFRFFFAEGEFSAEGGKDGCRP